MKRKLKVVSLFDGISCAMLALKKADFEIESYNAFEIDKNAIQISKKNFPEIIQNGSVIGADFKKFAGNCDLVCGGSPCQDLSSANKNGKGLNGEKSKLFFEFVRAVKEIKPKYFLLENVYSMTKENKDRISAELGVEPILINSELVSGQSRKRYYWTNIPNVKQPEQKQKVVVKDIMEPAENVTEKYWLENKTFDYYGAEKRVVGLIHGNKIYRSICDIYNENFPSRTLTTDKRIYYLQNGKIRRLTELEWERLQGLPENYTTGIAGTNRYKAIGNGWNVPTISHIFSFIPY